MTDDPITAAARDVLGDSYRQIERCLAGVSVEGLNWRPGPDTSSIAVLATHALGSCRSWLCVAFDREPPPRTRAHEFVTPDDPDAFRAGVAGVIADCLALLDTNGSVNWGVLRLTRRRATPGQRHLLPAAYAIAHAIDHVREHVGQMLLTRQLWDQRLAAAEPALVRKDAALDAAWRPARPRYEAVIFDMDGVLADSEPVYYNAVNVVLAHLGKAMTLEHQRAVMGHSIEDTWLYLIRELALEGPIDELVDAYDLELRRMLAELHETLPGVRELIEALRARGVPIAVASSSLPEWIEALLGGIGLRDAFTTAVSAKYVEHPKPAPDVYLLAADQLGVDPERCIAIEDTPTGLGSARAAGMLTVQVRAASTAFPPLPEADIILDTLRDFDLSLLDVASSE